MEDEKKVVEGAEDVQAGVENVKEATDATQAGSEPSAGVDAAQEASDEGDVQVDGKDLENVGVRESGTNEDAIAAALEGDDAGDGTRDALPVFFVKPEKRIRVEIDILFDKKTGDILNMSRAGFGINFDKFTALGHTREWAEFTQPTYDDLATYRQKSAAYNPTALRTLVDAVRLRNCFIVWHLKAWSLRDDEGKPVEFAFNPNGSMDDESIINVYNVYPPLIDVFLTLFEKEALLAT